MSVSLLESSPDLPLVSLTVAARTGASEDPSERAGLTRLACRLMRRTGLGLTPQELDTRIDALGASLWPEVGHAAASFGGTLISRSLDPFRELLEGVLARPGLSDEELERLRRETDAELVESLDDDRSTARRWFRKRLYGAHPHALSPAGTRSGVRNITAEAVKQRVAELFTRDNLLLAVSGDVDPERAAALAEQLTAALPAGTRRCDPAPEPSMIPGRRLLIVDKPERTQTQILIGGLGTHPSDEDHTALLVANTIFGGNFTARLTQEVREKRGWSYGAYSSLPYGRRRGAFSMWTFPKAEDAAPCIELQLGMLQAWRDDGVTQEELDWARSYLVRSHAFTVDTASKRVGLKVEAEINELPDGYYDGYLDRVRGVTLEQANAAIRNRISEENLLVVVLGTESLIGESLRRAVPDASVEVVPFDAE